MRLRDDARLARAGAGEDQQRAVGVKNRFALFGIEACRGNPLASRFGQRITIVASLPAEPLTACLYSTVTLFARLRG